MQKVAAIVPAFNEEKNVANVLKVLLSSEYLDEIILVDDGSTDRTAKIGKELGVKVIRLKNNIGKGNAMKEGVMATDADIIVFFDADLVGLQREHIFSLVNPILKDRAVMHVGIRERLFGLPKLFIKIDPLLAIGGERAMKRFLFESIPVEFLQGFVIETALNYHCYVRKLPVSYTELKGLKQKIKEQKWDVWKGFKSRLKMILQMLKIRWILIVSRDSFFN